MQSVSSRIWTRVAVSISYDDNHYAAGASKISVVAYIQFIYTFVTDTFVAYIVCIVKNLNVLE